MLHLEHWLYLEWHCESPYSTFLLAQRAPGHPEEKYRIARQCSSPRPFSLFCFLNIAVSWGCRCYHHLQLSDGGGRIPSCVALLWGCGRWWQGLSLDLRHEGSGGDATVYQAV